MSESTRKSWTCRGEHDRPTPVDLCRYCGAPPGVEAGKRKPKHEEKKP